MEGEEFRNTVAVYDDPHKKDTRKAGKVLNPNFWRLDDNKMKERQAISKHLRCLARTDPCDKRLFVEMLKANTQDHYIVATGDQTTDAKALEASDIGITINSGSDFTKTKAGILFWRNDGFALAKDIVEHGRSLY